MEVQWNEVQKMLRDSAADFLVAECPKAKTRELEEDPERGYSPQTWGRLADLGWLGLMIPEEYGGQGMTFQDLTVILEEMGRNIFPSPFFATVIGGAIPILDAGTEEQKRFFLPKIARGEAICSLALIEGMNPYYPSDIKTKVIPHGRGFVLGGTKLFVEMGHAADYIVCAARTGGGASAEAGITLFIVDARSDGIRTEIMPTMGMDKLCAMRFEKVIVPQGNVLGTLHEGWPIVDRVITRGAVAKCAEAIGGMQASMELAVSYSKERIQYGQPIGAFQVLQHWMADMFIATETGRYLTYQAAWLASEGLECTKEASQAKAYVNEAYKTLTQKAVRIHGGMGTTRDHDIGLYFRRAKTMSLAFGDTTYHRQRVADAIGLVRVR